MNERHARDSQFRFFNIVTISYCSMLIDDMDQHNHSELWGQLIGEFSDC